MEQTAEGVAGLGRRFARYRVTLGRTYRVQPLNELLRHRDRLCTPVEFLERGYARVRFLDNDEPTGGRVHMGDLAEAEPAASAHARHES